MGSYRVAAFDGIELPSYNPDRDDTPGAVASPLRATIGGMFDMAGSRRLLPLSRQIKVSGVYIAEFPNYIVDDVGDNLVDGSDPWITAASQVAESRDQLDLLTSRIGSRGTLVRYRWDDSSVLQTCVARLLVARAKFNKKWRTGGNDVELVFETIQTGWRSAVQSTVTASNGTLTAPNQGNLPVRTPTLAITASATITSIVCTIAEVGVAWSWAGTLNSGQTLTVDGENQTVRIGSTDAYYGFALASSHSNQAWMELAPGHNAVSLVVDGAHSATLTWFDQFA